MKKKKKLKTKVKRKSKVDPNIEETYWDTVTFYCPIRKKQITQKIQVKKYKTLADILKKAKSPVVSIDPLTEIEETEDNTIYGDTSEADD